jgi:21S rRNA (GM2251-2'-O)-methyltransferase
MRRLQKALSQHFVCRLFYSTARSSSNTFFSPQLPPPPSQDILVHGLHASQAVLTTGSRRILKGYIMISDAAEDEPLQKIEEELRFRKIQVVRSERNSLARLARGATHQGVVLEVTPAETRELLPGTPPSSFLRNSVDGINPYPLMLLLDEVVDPHNLGAIMRSAFLLGADAIVLSKHGSAPLGATASKSSSGAMEAWLASGRLFHTRNTTTLVQSLGDSGWRTIGAVAAPVGEGGGKGRPVPASTLRRDMPTLLVLGNEGEGMRPVIRKSCQTLCYLEQEPLIALKKWPNIVDSLNVSVAAALLLNRLQAL